MATERRFVSATDARLAALDAGPLRAAPRAQLHRWLAGALLDLRRGIEAGDIVPPSRLSPPLLLDALETASPDLAALEQASAALADTAVLGAEPRPMGRVAMILPSNVETAGLRPLVWALLARNAVAVRVSSRAPGLTGAFLDALRARDPQLARALCLLETPRDDAASLAALGRWADALHVWGHDETLETLARAWGRQPFAHGSGVSLAVVSGAGRASLAALARDIARHEQRGCLSPQAVLIEASPALASLEAASVAQGLFEALGALEPVWPRSVLSSQEAAAERVWRDTAAALAEWVGVGASHAVSLEHGALRDTPGYRHIAVHVMPSAAIDALLARLGPRLKSLGVEDPSRWQARAPAHAHVVALGQMQTPSLLAPADGAPPWHGFLAPTEHSPRSTRTTPS